MSYERPIFVTGSYYHVYNRGVAKQPIFADDHDRIHLLDTLSYYLEDPPEKRLSLLTSDTLHDVLSKPVRDPLVEIVAYCLMPNHFHLLVRQLKDMGISTYLRRLQNSYTRYYNTRHSRVGTMFQGRFQAVAVTNDEQLLQVSRYIHLNPVVARIVHHAEDYSWSSYSLYQQATMTRLCNPELILSMVGSPAGYHDFTLDYVEYAISLHENKKLMLDI